MGLLILVGALLLITPVDRRRRGGRRQLGLAVLVSAVAVLANPLGPGLYASVIAGVFDPGVAQNLAGLASPDFHDWSARLFEAEVVLVIVLWTVGGGPDRFSAVTGFALLVAALFAQENIGILAVFLAPEIAIHGSRAWHRHVAPRLGTWSSVTQRHLHPDRDQRRCSSR